MEMLACQANMPEFGKTTKPDGDTKTCRDSSLQKGNNFDYAKALGTCVKQTGWRYPMQHQTTGQRQPK